MGNRITGPDDAFKYAQGQTIKHPLGYDIKIDTPMDFMGVTDHSEYVGVTKEANTPGSAVSKLPEAQPLIMKDPNSNPAEPKPPSYTCSSSPQRAGQGVHETRRWLARSGRKTSRSPTRTTIPASSQRSARTSRRRKHDNRNLHRNIFFRDCDNVPDDAVQRARLHGIPRTCGSGWTRSARQATSCSPSRTTPT